MNDYTTKCPNCGAPLHPGTTDIIKCTYCGSSYQGKTEIKEAKKPLPVTDDEDWQKDNAKDPDADGSMASGAIAVFIFFFIILIIVIASQQ